MACRAAEPLDPTDEIDIASDHREIEPQAGADIAVTDLTMMESNASAHYVRIRRYVGEPGLNRVGRNESGSAVSRRLFLGLEKRQNGVADEFEDLAAVGGDGWNNLVKVEVEALEHLGGRQT